MQRTPLIILIAGTGCSGKSVLATQLAARMNIPRLVQTDTVARLHHVLRRDKNKSTLGVRYCHCRLLLLYLCLNAYAVCRISSVAPLYLSAFESDGHMLQDYRQECAAVRAGTSPDLKRTDVSTTVRNNVSLLGLYVTGLEHEISKCLKEGKSLILEGIHLDPGFYAQLGTRAATGTAVDAIVSSVPQLDTRLTTGTTSAVRELSQSTLLASPAKSTALPVSVTSSASKHDARASVQSAPSDASISTKGVDAIVVRFLLNVDLDYHRLLAQNATWVQQRQATQSASSDGITCVRNDIAPSQVFHQLRVLQDHLLAQASVHAGSYRVVPIVHRQPSVCRPSDVPSDASSVDHSVYHAPDRTTLSVSVSLDFSTVPAVSAGDSIGSNAANIDVSGSGHAQNVLEQAIDLDRAVDSLHTAVLDRIQMFLAGAPGI